VIEGTLIDLMDERIVPSIRRHRWSGWQSAFIADEWWLAGGLEAQQYTCMMTFAVLPISPYRLFISHG